MIQERSLQALKTLLPKGAVFTDRASLLTYESDAGLDKALPDGIVFPRTAEDVVQIVRWAAQNNVPLIARGAGTGLSGGAVADRGGVIVEFSRMNQVIHIDVNGRRVLAEPGVINLVLDNRVKQHDLYFPPDPASQRASTLGGNVAENSGGPHCFKYGVTTNYILGLDVVLADGQRVRVGGPALDYPEYDLCGLITGSEGMLAIMNSITGRLVRNPPGVKTMLAIFHSVEDAGHAVSALIAAGLVPATMELMDQKIIGIAEPFAQAGLPLDAGAILIIELDGYPESLDAQAVEIDQLARQHGAYAIRTAQTAEERARIWLARKSVAGAITRLAPAYYTVDVTVPRSRLAEVLAKVDVICERYQVRTGYLLHAGDGNLHPMMLIPNPSDHALIQRVLEASHEMVKLCVDMEGSLTGEHGVGIEKRDYMSLMHTPAELMAMWDVKMAFDGRNILNPGKVFPTPAAHETGPFAGYTTAPIPVDSQMQIGEIFTPTTAHEAARGLAVIAQQGRSVRITGTPEARIMPSHLTEASIVLSTARLSGIKTYAPDDLYITVGAGTPLTEVQQFLASKGKMIALTSPWPTATVGGLVAANVNAPFRMRYGAMRDVVLCATVALPDGRLIRVGRPIVKNVAGYDLTRAFVGSYGTLGLLTDITFKLIVQPRKQSTLLYPVEDLQHGLLWARKVLPLSLVASAIVLTKGHQQTTVSALPQSPYLLAYTAEGIAEDVQAELTQVRSALRAAQAPEPIELESLTGTALWTTMLAQAKETALLLRIGVSSSDLPIFMQDHAALLNRGTYIADISAGSLYALATWENADEAEAWVTALRQAALAAQGYALVMEMPAAFAHRVERWGYEPQALSVMRRLKQRWDAQSILNPGMFIVG